MVYTCINEVNPKLKESITFYELLILIVFVFLFNVIFQDLSNAYHIDIQIMVKKKVIETLS